MSSGFVCYVSEGTTVVVLVRDFATLGAGFVKQTHLHSGLIDYGTETVHVTPLKRTLAFSS